MRLKSPAKLQQIIDAAARLFLEHGVECTSMSQIARSVGGSKATLYNYFSSKEQIHVEVLLQSACKFGSHVTEALNGDAPLAERLERFAHDFLTFILSPQMKDIRRTLIYESRKPDIGKKIYESGPKKKWVVVAEHLQKAMERGEMKKADPWVAAMQFRALIEAELLDRCLLNTGGEPGKDTLDQTIPRALDMFCTYYQIKR